MLLHIPELNNDSNNMHVAQAHVPEFNAYMCICQRNGMLHPRLYINYA